MKNNFSTMIKSSLFQLFSFCIFTFSISSKVNAQTAASYSFSTTTGTYTPITGGTRLSFGTTMDNASFAVTIPSFTYLGTAYTQVFASENGYIQFGTTGPTTTMRLYLSSTETSANSGIAGYSRDLWGKSASSELRTQTIGSEVIFQWTNMANFASTAQTVTFQIRLNTSTNVIVVVYNMSATTSTTAQVGLRGSTTDFNNRTSTTSWTSSASGAVNTAAMTLSATVFPASGYNYIWTPPAPCSAKPLPGTLSSSAGSASICPFTKATLSVAGSTVTTGIAYSWDSSTVSATGPWSTISGATASTYAAGPAACKTVFYRRRTICVPSGLYDSSNAVSVTVKCAITPPYFENFESITTADALPNCMTATNLTTMVTTYLTASTFNRSNHTPGGSKYAAFRWGSNDYIFTPGITVDAGKTYQLSFWYITDGLAGWDSLKLQYGSSPSASGMTTTLASLTKLSNTAYKKFSVQFVATTSGVQYFGFNCKASSVPWYLSIDDISLQEVPLCSGTPSTGTPTANLSRVCGSGSVELDLPSLPAALGYVYQWQDSSAGGTWGTGLGRPTFGGTTLPFTTGVFSVNTYFRCIVTCSTSGLSAISPAIAINAGPYTPPYFENFESITVNNELPTCMSATNLGSLVLSYTANSTLGRANHTLGGSKYTSFRWSCDDYIFSPQMRLLAGQQYILSFWYITDGLTGWNTLSAKVGLDATDVAMTKTLKTIKNPINTTYAQYIDTFTVPFTDNYYIGIYCNAGGVPWYLSIDDIGLQMRPCSGMPTAASIVSAVPSGSGTCANNYNQLKGVGGTISAIPGIKYQWQRRKLPLTSSTWQNIIGANDSLIAGDTLGGYDYRLAIVCTNTNDSAFSSVYSLPLLAAHPPISISPATSPIVFCLGDTVKFNATNYPGSVYDWMKDSVVIPGWKFSDLGATDAGVYYVRASNTGTPCPAYSNNVILVQNDPGYSVTITTPSDSIVCEGVSLLLTASGSKGGLTYQWYKDNTAISGVTTSSCIVAASGVYRVTAFDGVSTCPASSRSVNIVVNKNPVASLTVIGGSTTACENEGILLKANSGAFSYEWTKGGLTIYGWGDSMMRVKSSGLYSVKVRDANGCASVTAPPVNVNIIPSPIPVITRSGFKLSTGIYSSYRWIRNGSEFISSAPFINVSKKGFYKVIVTDANNCEGESLSIEMMDDVLNINNVNLEQNVLVYPNPTNSKVYIESPVSLDVEVKDITGRTIISLHNAKEIDLSKYADGIYVFYLSYEGQLLQQQKITKNAQK